MIKINIFLFLILIISALGVVTAQHKVRKFSVALENENVISHQLKVKWGRLQLEQSTLGMHTRIESIANEKLNMIMPAASHVRMIPIKKNQNNSALEP